MHRKLAAVVGAAALIFAFAPAAFAHVTVQPTEAATGSFARFVVRVPNERSDTDTVKVEVQFPEDLVFVSFQPRDGWQREVTMKKLDQPIEVFGEEVDEVIDTVTWSGGTIGPGEFDEFGFSAKVPDDATTVTFAALQSYAGGEVVRWIGPPDADAPAPQVEALDVGLGEDEGELALLADVREEVASLNGKLDEESSEGGSGAVILGSAGVVLGAAALVLVLMRRS